MHARSRAGVAIVGVAVALTGLASQPLVQPKSRKCPVIVSWEGQVSERSRNGAPKAGVIADSRTWEKLWKSWRVSEPVPYVDFQEAIVLVAVNGDPNRISVDVTVTESGTLIVNEISQMRGFGLATTYGYQLALVGRQGVKACRGQAIGEDQ